jgi:hypothetical protein
MIPGSLLNGYITAKNQYFEKVLGDCREIDRPTKICANFI